MSEFIQNFSIMITEDRSWSWSVVGILYLGLTLIIRNWFLRPLVKLAKDLKRSHYTEIKGAYLKQALSGWMLYLASLALVLVVWIQPKLLPLRAEHVLMLFAAFLCFILSMMLHLQAMAAAGLTTLKRVEVAHG